MADTSRSKFEQVLQNPLYIRVDTAMTQVTLLRDNLEPLMYSSMVDPLLAKQLSDQLIQTRVTMRAILRQMRGEEPQ